MTATLIRDEPEYQYPCGSCHLRVWRHEDGGMVAVLHEPATGTGASIANRIEPILQQLDDQYTDDYGSRPMVVQHTDAGAFCGAEWHDVIEVNGVVEWRRSSASEQASDLGVTVAALIPEGMSA